MDGNILFIGTQANALLLAVDKNDGRLIDKVQISKHPIAIITQSPTFWQGTLFVGSSSDEEYATAVVPDYVCCSFIANMNAFTLQNDSFKLLWSQDMIPRGSNFSGAAIWGSQPSIDPVRNQVFIATGNVYSTPPEYTACLNKTANSSNTSQDNTTDSCVPQGVYQESVLAFDAATGHINWSRELSPLDAWTVACTAVPKINPSDCPPSPGPDADFGMAPSFVSASEYTPFGKDTLVVGQKNGNLYAMSAQSGELSWATATSPDGDEGGLIWGIAVGKPFFDFRLPIQRCIWNRKTVVPEHIDYSEAVPIQRPIFRILMLFQEAMLNPNLSDSSAVYYTAANYDRTLWRLQNGTSLSNSAFGALNLTTGTILWETPVPANDSSLVIPSIVNDVVMIGRSGSYAPSGASITGPGSLISLDKDTGLILGSWALDSYFHGSIAVVSDFVMFGTGYETEEGSFNVWKVDNANMMGL